MTVYVRKCFSYMLPAFWKRKCGITQQGSQLAVSLNQFVPMRAQVSVVREAVRFQVF